MARARLTAALRGLLSIRDADLDNEYGLGGSGGGGGGGTTPTAPVSANATWAPGTLYYTGNIVEPTAENGFYYTASGGPAYSGGTEPAWPTSPGGTVVDGGITWTATAKAQITWTAVPLYKSGGVEPTWNTTVGGTTVDGSMTWITRTPAITDSRCPQSRVALVIASKVFSPYRDVLRYCATEDPTDWSTEDDAGFLPIGQHSPTSPEVTALGSYRGRLAALTPSDLQLWTVDPDPAEMGIYDTIPGAGSTYHACVVPVANDLYYLTPQGVRSVSVAGSNGTLAAGDVGSGVDPLVVALLAGPSAPVGTYYPGQGQTWFVFGNQVLVYTHSRLGKVGAWSRYLFPWAVTAHAHLNGELYLRSENDDWFRMDPDAVDDDGTAFEGIVWTPYLDLGNPGVNKFLNAIDVVGSGSFSLSIGYDQTDTSLYTPAYTLPEDSVPGTPIPMPVVAPSMAFKLTFAAGQSWELNAMNVYLDDMGVG